MGKAEGAAKEWHGHVTALTVAPSYRRLGLAKIMMDELERVSQDVYDGYFVDLFVRVSNLLAIGMYRGMGYSVYRRVVEYYSGGADEIAEDAFGMCFFFLSLSLSLSRYCDIDEIISPYFFLVFVWKTREQNLV